jgi:hypothetical protein
VVHPDVATGETSVDEGQRLRRARAAALQIAQDRRDALARHVRRLEEELEIVEDAQARERAQSALEHAYGQLEAAEREVERLRRDGE